MNILLIRWGAYTENDIENECRNLGLDIITLVHPFQNKYVDEEFDSKLSKIIKDSSIDAVFTVNYFPVVALACNHNNTKYISWSYDAPLNVIDIENTLGLETNYVFMFDRVQAEGYINHGFKNVYYLPLAVATKRYDNLKIDSADKAKYTSDISFVGNLYGDDLRNYIAPLPDYYKGLIEGMCSAQKQLYGCYFLNEVVTNELIKAINDEYKRVKSDTEFAMNKPALEFAMSSSITRQERLTILGLLSKHSNLTYYSREKHELLSNASYGGTCDYYSEMPKVFKSTLINLNITLKILTSGIPLRALDIMGCGGFLLSNYQPELAEYFVDGNEIVMYESIEDAFEKCNYYLSNKDKIKEIALKGYQKVKNDFNYKERIGHILKVSKMD